MWWEKCGLHVAGFEGFKHSYSADSEGTLLAYLKGMFRNRCSRVPWI